MPLFNFAYNLKKCYLTQLILFAMLKLWAFFVANFDNLDCKYWSYLQFSNHRSLRPQNFYNLFFIPYSGTNTKHKCKAIIFLLLTSLSRIVFIKLAIGITPFQIEIRPFFVAPHFKFQFVRKKSKLHNSKKKVKNSQKKFDILYLN